MKEKSAIFSAVLGNPADAVSKLAYADVLEEEGEYPLAYAYRWMAKHNKHPHYRERYIKYRFGVVSSEPGASVPEKYRWVWLPDWQSEWWLKANGFQNTVPAQLPRLVYLAMAPHSDKRLYGSFQEAVANLADGLAKKGVFSC